MTIETRCTTKPLPERQRSAPAAWEVTASEQLGRILLEGRRRREIEIDREARRRVEAFLRRVADVD